MNKLLEEDLRKRYAPQQSPGLRFVAVGSEKYAISNSQGIIGVHPLGRHSGMLRFEKYAGQTKHAKVFETAHMSDRIAEAAASTLEGSDTGVYFIANNFSEASVLDNWLINHGASYGEKVIIERGYWSE